MAEADLNEADVTDAVGVEHDDPLETATGATGGELPPPAVPAHDPPLRWCRSEERILFGVAGGLADALALDPLLVRLVFVALGAFGVGIGLYLAGALLLAPGPYGPRPSAIRKVLGIAVLVVTGLFVMGGGGLDLRWHRGGWWPAAIAIAVAAALWYPRRTHLATPPAGGPTTAVDAAAAPARPPATPGPPRPPRRRSVAGRIAFAVALAVAAIGSATAGGDQGRLKVVFGVAAVVLGVGMLVAAFSVHARWLIVPAVLAAGASVVFAAVDGLGVRLGPGDGGDTVADGSSSAPVSPRYDQRSGTIRLQLGQLDHDVTTVVRMGTGNVEVDVPDNARVVLRGRVGVGQIETPERIVRGYRRRVVDEIRVGDGSGPTITLDASVGIGQLDVLREQPLVAPRPTPQDSGAAPEVALPPGVASVDPDGTRYYLDGIVLAPDGTITLADGTIVRPDGSREYASPVRVLADGAALLPDGTLIDADGTVHASDGTMVRPVPPTTASTGPPATAAPSTSPSPTTASPSTAGVRQP